MSTSVSMQLLTPADAAAVLGMDIKTIYRWCKAGDLPCYRIGPKRAAVRIKLADLETYVERGKQEKPESLQQILRKRRVR